MHPQQTVRLAVVALGLGLAIITAGCGPSAEKFPVETYQKSPENLQGNRYDLDAEIDAQLDWQEGVGRLIAVKPLGSSSRLPVFIPDSLNANLMVAQRYRFEINVRKGGLLNVVALRKL